MREALRNLERSGLVALQAGARGGAFIGHGDASLISDSFRNLYQLGSVSLDELTEARLWLASTVVRIACERATEADLEALTANVDEAEGLIRARRFEEKIDVQIEFHNILARGTRNAVLPKQKGATMEVMRDFAHAAGGERNDLTIKARRRLLAALRKRDAEAAVAAMTDHLGGAARTLPRPRPAGAVAVNGILCWGAPLRWRAFSDSTMRKSKNFGGNDDAWETPVP